MMRPQQMQGAGAHPVILRANSPATPGTIQDTLPPALPVQRIPNPHGYSGGGASGPGGAPMPPPGGMFSGAPRGPGPPACIQAPQDGAGQDTEARAPRAATAPAPRGAHPQAPGRAAPRAPATSTGPSTAGPRPCTTPGVRRGPRAPRGQASHRGPTGNPRGQGP